MSPTPAAYTNNGTTTLRKDGMTGDNNGNNSSDDSNGPFPLQVREGFFPS
jgi:hypothetical protein